MTIDEAERLIDEAGTEIRDYLERRIMTLENDLERRVKVKIDVQAPRGGHFIVIDIESPLRHTRYIQDHIA